MKKLMIPSRAFNHFVDTGDIKCDFYVTCNVSEENDLLIKMVKELKKEVERLKEYEFMYKSLDK